MYSLTDSHECSIEIPPAGRSGPMAQNCGPYQNHRMLRSFQTREIRKWEGFIMNMVIFPKIDILGGNI